MAVDYTDHTIKNMLDAMHARLKSGAGSKPLGYHDDAKSSLDYPPAPPLKITPPHAAGRRLNVDGTPKK